jgi:23S rRNA-/tRNA-specific pseudouridylate synthase
MMEPVKPKNSFRVTLQLTSPRPRLDQVLMEELRKQSRNLLLKNISRTDFKELFKNKKIRIKGQPATPSSSLAAGTTYVDIIGFNDVE